MLFERDACALGLAVLDASQAPSAEIIYPLVVLSRKVLHLELHAVQVRPTSCKAQ